MKAGRLVFSVAALALLSLPLLANSEIPHSVLEKATEGGMTSTIIASVALLVAVGGLLSEIYSKRHHERMASYDHLDRAYQELYSIAGRHSHVVNPQLTWSLDAMELEQRFAYEAYVWKSWIICESVYDQTHHKEEIWNTWKTAIDIEARLHITWMLREIFIKPDSFKKKFRDFVCQEYGRPDKLQKLKASAFSRYATLRPATLADIDTIMALEHSGFEAGIRETRETFESRLNFFPEGFCVLIVPGEESPIGYICAELWQDIPSPSDVERIEIDHSIEQWHDSKGEVLYISSQTVSPRFRGTKIGELMFRQMVERLCRIYPHLNQSYLVVNETWTQARKIYERCGFTECGEAKGFFKPQNKNPQNGILMIASLPIHWTICG